MQNAREYLIIYDKRRRKFKYHLAMKAVMKRKRSDWSKSADETYFPAFQQPKSKNLYVRCFEEECSVCHLKLERWRLIKNIVRLYKMYRVPFWKKSSENLLKWHRIYWSTLWNLIKNGHSRGWMWHWVTFLKTCMHEFQKTMAGVTGKNAFFINYSNSVTKANSNSSSESFFRGKLNHKIISRGNLFMQFNLYARWRKLRTVSLMFLTSMFSR